MKAIPCFIRVYSNSFRTKKYKGRKISIAKFGLNLVQLRKFKIKNRLNEAVLGLGLG